MNRSKTECCDCKSYTGKKEACENYSDFRQLNTFELDKKQYMCVLIACEESQRVCMEFRRLCGIERMERQGLHWKMHIA